MLAQLRQRLCARRSVFVRNFQYCTTATELSEVFEPFGIISKVNINQIKVRSDAPIFWFYKFFLFDIVISFLADKYAGPISDKIFTYNCLKYRAE